MSDVGLAGWTEVTTELLAGAAGLGPDDLARYYDGGHPDWRHALAAPEQVLRRQAVGPAVGAFDGPVEMSMVLLVGPGGQGRSTVARQVAVDLARAGRHRVLFREPGTSLDADAVVALPTGPWVLVSDDAEEIAPALEAMLTRLTHERRRDVHWVLVAREADWDARFRRDGRMAEPPWERYVNLWPTRGMRSKLLALAPAEADGLAEVWEAAGSLRALESDPAEERGQCVLDATESRDGLSNATLLGGILDQRFGPGAIGDHVAGLLADLGDQDRQAFLYAAAVDALDFDGVDLSVVADLLGVDRAERLGIRQRLVPSGLATGSGAALRARHPSIARAAVALVDQSGVAGADLEGIWRRLTRATARAGKELGPLVSDGPIMTCAPLMVDRYARCGVDRGRAEVVARAAADEAAEAMSGYCLFTVLRARTYRTTGDPAAASRILREAFAADSAKQDWDRMARGYLYELALAEAALGHWLETIVSAGLSLVDAPGVGPVTSADAKIALVEIGEACLRMDEPQLVAGYAPLLRSAAAMSPTVTPKWDQPTRARFKAFTERADELEVPPCTLNEGFEWFAQTTARAVSEVGDADLDAMWARLVGNGAGHAPGIVLLRRIVAIR